MFSQSCLDLDYSVPSLHAAVEASIHLIADTFPGWLGDLLARLPAWEGRLAEYVAAVADRWFARPEYRALLAQLLFEHRDRLWDLLVWRGRHGQAPNQVSQHPEYWLHLDVGASVRAILKGNKALFLHTRPVQESLKDPLFFELDPSFWREGAAAWLFARAETSAADARASPGSSQDKQRLWQRIVERLVNRTPWRDLFRRLGPLLDAQRLAQFARQPAWRAAVRAASAGDLVTCASWASAEDLLAAGAIAYSASSLAREFWMDGGTTEVEALRRALNRVARLRRRELWHANSTLRIDTRGQSHERRKRKREESVWRIKWTVQEREVEESAERIVDRILCDAQQHFEKYARECERP
ncbi:hypothetical protein QBZ16_003131 [Prototheca wickerhamii]|uniref:Uncharacterized protein n=1 Tax=Prototheca wickerhamii TaxID=3111 RepID=A0AAD9MI17_PROWI|nr:hypothetical protein QBZ16_003131 [Prototheca wickerhamii]